MKFEFSAGGIVFRQVFDSEGAQTRGAQGFGLKPQFTKKNLEILVAQHSQHHGWVFPKGLIGDHVKDEKKSVSARQLAVFLESVEAEEALLVQRWIDRENESVREAAGYRSAVSSTKAPRRISREEPSDNVEPALADREQPATLYGSF